MSDLEDYLLGVIRGRKGVGATLLRGGLAGLAWLYAGGLECYLWLYRVGLKRQKRLDSLVICVGNLTTGGTGKTPLTQTLCRKLLAERRRVAILSRGYGGTNEYGCAIVSDTEKVLLGAKEAGDEAYLLAKSLPGVPVVVGKERRTTGALACERFQPHMIVLDDGMQFWWLYKDILICLLNACEPFDNGWVFPRGLLREPKSHLRRAQVVVLTNAKRAGERAVEALRAEVKRLAPRALVLTADLVPLSIGSLEGGREYALEWLRGKRVVTVAALGNPASFEEMVEKELGAVLVNRHRYRDHFALTAVELQKVVDDALNLQADLILTTEKDAVKLPAFQSTVEIGVLKVQMDVDLEQVYGYIVKVLH